MIKYQHKQDTQLNLLDQIIQFADDRKNHQLELTFEEFMHVWKQYPNTPPMTHKDDEHNKIYSVMQLGALTLFTRQS